jgi:hypothetical protein
MPKPKAATVRSISRQVAEKPACAPLKAMYDAAAAEKPKSWNEIEPAFLRAMEAFDRNLATGIADMGDLQNGKGDFFNDLLALILENCAGVTLYSRGDVPGFIFPKHYLDVTYPITGVVEFLLEAKAVGTPKHPGSSKQKAIGRDGSADLDKRVKEAAFKTIDLKAEFGRIMAERGESPPAGPGGNLTTWLRSVLPRSYLFIAARVTGASDLARTIKSAEAAAQVMDGVGLYCFQPLSSAEPTTYHAVSVPTALQLARTLFRVCQDLAGVKTSPRVPEPRTPSPGAQISLVADKPDEPE